MDQATIKQSIQNWTAILKNPTDLIRHFDEGNSIIFDKPVYKNTTPQWHVYPGIYNDNLYFFLIPSVYDNSATVDIASYVTVCQVGWIVGSNRIPSADARLRIDAWVNNYKKWTPQQVATTDGMFQAFMLDTIDFEVTQTKLTLGLQTGSTALPLVDMIVTNLDGTSVYYDDYAKSVPPFGGAAAASSNFYLLS